MSNGKNNAPAAQSPLKSSIDVVADWCGTYPKKSDKLEDLCHLRYPDWKPTAGSGSTPPMPGQGSIILSSMLSAENHGRYTGAINQNLLINLADPTVAGLANELGW
ncbi:MAG: hypothetical protein WAL75_03850 [Terracidiphilus sp.]